MTVWHEEELATLRLGDCLKVLAEMEPDSADLVCTSPPYFALRSYTDGGEHYANQIGSEPTPQAFLEALWAVTAECVRVLKPTGSLWVNLGDKYAGSGGNNQSGVGAKAQKAGPSSYNKASDGIPAKSLMGLPWRYAIGCIDQLGLILRAEVIWSKPNGLPESVTDRVRRSHEQWFHMTKEPRYFSAVDEVREEYAPGTEARYQVGFKRTGTEDAQITKGYDGGDGGPTATNPLGKLPGSVWQIPTEPLRVPDHLGVDHFAAFPSEWPRRIILGWSPSGVCVACGEGRRPVVAKDLHFTQATHTRPKQGEGYKAGHLGVPGTNEVTITGYACACPDTTAPTTPAVVLDPFCGTGTTVAVAKALGRHGVGIDMSEDYLRLARWRIDNIDLAVKVAERSGMTAPEGEHDGMIVSTLFEEA